MYLWLKGENSSVNEREGGTERENTWALLLFDQLLLECSEMLIHTLVRLTKQQ